MRDSSPQIDDAHSPDAHGPDAHGHGEHGDVHLPPNSWVPIAVAIAMLVTLVGLLPPMAPYGAVVGGVFLVGCLVAWVRGARNEFNDLP